MQTFCLALRDALFMHLDLQPVRDESPTNEHLSKNFQVFGTIGMLDFMTKRKSELDPPWKTWSS